MGEDKLQNNLEKHLNKTKTSANLNSRENQEPIHEDDSWIGIALAVIIIICMGIGGYLLIQKSINFYKNAEINVSAETLTSKLPREISIKF